MEAQIIIGHLVLNMGSASHVVGGTKTEEARKNYMNYIAYQYKVNPYMFFNSTYRSKRHSAII